MLDNPLLMLLGIGVLLFLAFDLFTTIAQSNEGLASRMVQALMHHLLTQLYRLTHRRVFLAWASTVLILGLLLTWSALLYVGWLLIFSSDGDSVLRSQDQTPATFWNLVYFTGFTISTLGVGDYVPNGGFWQFMTTIAALSGFFLLTFIISFLLSVIQKQALRRKLAMHIHHLGQTPQAIIMNHWDSREGQLLNNALDALISDLVQFEQQQLNQPILNRFHERSKRQSIELALVTLDEALTLGEHAAAVALPTQARHARKIITGYLDSLNHLPFTDDAPPIPDLTPLRTANMPLFDEQTIEAAYAALRSRRQKLQALLKSTGLTWETVTQS